MFTTAAGHDEADADIADDYPSDVEQAQRVLCPLAEFTSAPQECYLCLWDGYSDAALPPQVQRGPW